jgi:mannose/cellobiose epimerase-like protein (N-acyl-D-glucosamine 2-epimerase family)
MAIVDTARIRYWLFHQALPFWAEHGLDHKYGGPVEEVALDGTPSDPGFKRVRVFCRQVYVFSHAALLGWEPGQVHARAMFDAMVQFAWQGPEKGWAKTLRHDNSVLDATTDLYDNAFALFSIGWYYRICPQQDVLDYMVKTAALIDTKLRHPKVGFWHQLPPTGPRLQNPHMHLLEACLVCFESTNLPVFERLAREVLGLFNSHFYDAKQQTLCEYYDDNLCAIEGDKGLIVEPGHQFEWAWILASAHKLLGVDVATQAMGLVDFGERLGVDAVSRATYNAIYSDGRPLDLGSRAWPNTERIKASVAMFDLCHKPMAPILKETVDLLFDRYLSANVTGGWCDAFDANMTPIGKAMPTSTFYHLFLAFAEVLRVTATK